MIDRSAFGVLSTSTRTRVFTLISDASFVRGTVRVKDTLRPATFVRVAYVVGKTGARTCAVLLPTNGVRSTGRWYTWVGDIRGWS